MNTLETTGFLAALLGLFIGWALFIRELIEHPLWAPRRSDLPKAHSAQEHTNGPTAEPGQ